jgi:hypothetical protein
VKTPKQKKERRIIMKCTLWVWVSVAVLAVMHGVAVPGEEPVPLRLDGTFVNQHKPLPGGDFETTYELSTTQQPYYYSSGVNISLTERTSYAVKGPLKSKIADAKPYYGTWLYGGKTKIPLAFSVIQVEQSEVPPKVLDPSSGFPVVDQSFGFPSEQREEYLFFKTVVDWNRDTNFNNDQAYYVFLHKGRAYSEHQMLLSIPVEYVTDDVVAPVQNLTYTMGLQWRQPARDSAPSNLTIHSTQVFEATVNFGDQRMKTWFIDQNLNGAWDATDFWVIDLNKDGRWDISSRFSVEKFGLGEAVAIGDKSYQLTRLDPAAKSLKVSFSELRAEPREIFGVGSTAPAFAVTDLLSRKMITSLDFKGKPYVIYYIRSSSRDQIAPLLDAAVTLCEKYLGLNNVGLIIAFDSIDWDSIATMFPPGHLPYYVINARSKEYDASGRQKHFMYGFKIDPDTMQSGNVLIGIDGNGIIRYISRDAGSDKVIELCQLLQSEIQRKGESGLTPSPTPTPEPTSSVLLSVPSVHAGPAPAPVAPTPESKVSKALDWFKANRDLLDKAFVPMPADPFPSRIFYQAGTAEGLGVHSKTFGQNDAIRLPGNDFATATPRLSADRKTLYVKIHEGVDNVTHILALTPGEEPKDVFQVKDFIWYYDISPDKTEIAYMMKISNLFQIFRQRLDGGEAIRFSDEKVGGVFPVYSPNGESIAYSASKKLRLKNIETGEEEVLVDDSLGKELPAWSPDGKWIAYQASAGDELSYDIYKVNVETKKVVRLTKEPGIDANPCFSADGSKIAFMSERETGNGNQVLYVMDADGSNVQRDPTSKPGIYFPRW